MEGGKGGNEEPLRSNTVISGREKEREKMIGKSREMVAAATRRGKVEAKNNEQREGNREGRYKHRAGARGMDGMKFVAFSFF